LWQVYTRPTSASDFCSLNLGFERELLGQNFEILSSKGNSHTNSDSECRKENVECRKEMFSGFHRRRNLTANLFCFWGPVTELQPQNFEICHLKASLPHFRRVNSLRKFYLIETFETRKGNTHLYAV
jgi:hypothetical protein